MINISVSRRALFVVVLVVALVIPAAALAGHLFDDVEDTNVHFPGIQFMKDSGVTVGCADGTIFCPNDPVTRAQMATFMYRLSGTDPGTPPSVNADTIDGLDSADLISPGQLHFPARALSENPSSGVITDTSDGYVWQNNGSEGANLTIFRPQAWDGTSDVVLRIGFWRTTNTGGTVQFFARPRTYAPGDTFSDTTGVLSDTATTAGLIFDTVTIEIPANRFGTNPYWQLVIQRNVETYPDDVRVTSVEMTFGT